MTTHAQTDRHIADAKAHLVARIEELGRRFHEARDKLDLSAQIAAHPLLAVGGAFAAGALLGMGRRIRVTPDGSVKRGISGTLVSALGALGIHLAKGLVTTYFSDAAKSWLDRRDASTPESFRDH